MKFKKVVKTSLALGVGTFAYSNVVERRNFALRYASADVLPAGHEPITILHLSDLHITGNQPWKEKWVASLAKYQPDLVINTGDNLSAVNAEPAVRRAMGALVDIPGAFVAGSNDYYSPGFRNPAKYLFAPSNQHDLDDPIVEKPRDLPYEDMFSYFENKGWLNLINASGELEIKGTRLLLSGVDDPHLDLDEFVGYPADNEHEGSDEKSGEKAVKIGVIHAPYQRVLDKFTADGTDVIFTGHTHGGQLRIPVYGAIIANCDIPVEQSRGFSQWYCDGHTAELNVSAGLGNSPYFPFRFACRPEATLLTLFPKKASHS